MTQETFDNLKTLFSTAFILVLFDPEKKSVLKTDTSDHISAEIHSQSDETELLQSVAFFSKKHSPQKCNYEIYDKKLLIIVLAFQKWRQELKDSVKQVKILSDH